MISRSRLLTSVPGSPFMNNLGTSL
jgi:hypothetical protein